MIEFIFGKSHSKRQHEANFKRSVEFQIVKELGYDWREPLENLLYEYIVYCKRCRTDVDEYRNLINQFAKTQYTNHFSFHLTITALVDSIKKFHSLTADMNLEDHYTFSVALEGMDTILNPKPLPSR